MKELNSLKHFIETIHRLMTSHEDIGLLIEMAYEENDESLIPEIEEELKNFKESYDAFWIQTLLSGEYDKDNAIVTLHAGAGGTESCDWASMLYRMYTRWAEKKGFTIEMLDFLDGDVAGLKTVTFQVNGENAYGYLKSEKGVHRLVRISPFNAAGKRQTSFASCDVVPDIEDEIDIDVNDDDLLWLVGENKKAVFNVALNSTYELRVSEETDIEIQRECIRPIYTCSYDRLYPTVSDGVCREVSCCFPERMRFEKVYRATREKYYKQILNVLTIPCVLLGVFITILPFLTGTTAGRIGGVVFGILSATAIFLLRLIGSGIVKYLCKLDCKTTFSQFESQKILSYFKQEKDL